MRHLFSACAVIGSALLASTGRVGAQERGPEQDTLRLDLGVSGIRIVRGVPDSTVLKVGILKAVDVARLVAPSPNAVAQAKLFEANYRQGFWTAALGVGTWSAIFAINHIGVNQPVPLGVTITSAVLVTYGAMRFGTAKRALVGAISSYNRDLKK